MPTIVTGSGNTYSTQDGQVWIRKSHSMDPFQWGGRCMKVGDLTESLGGQTVTTRQNPRGGIERDAIRDDVPGDTTTTLEMKRRQRDTMKTQLKICRWDIDKRITCDGQERDNPYSWEEIERLCNAKMTERTTSGTTWDAGEDAMVSFNVTGLDPLDLYRVVSTEAVAGIGGGDLINDVHVNSGSRCPGCGDPRDDCIVVMVTEDDTTNSYMLYSEAGGDFDSWNSVTLTDFGANDASAITGVDDFVFIVSTSDASAIWSPDLGTTQTEVTHADWASHPPEQVDMIDQTFIVICGQDGYIWCSRDGGRTIEQLSAGDATANNLTRIMIARDNPQVIYAVSDAADVTVKSTNGGRTWEQVGLTSLAGTGPTALWVIDQFRVLVGTDAGEVFETEDGGITWTEQLEIPGFTTKANVNIRDICGCGCGVLYLVADEDAPAADYKLFRNVDNGASGYWYEPDGENHTAIHYAIACCDANHAVAGGGVASTSEALLLVR